MVTMPDFQVIGAQHPEIELLVLFGSRARDGAHAQSDWDFACLTQDAGQLDALCGDLMVALQSNQVDVVDMRRISASMRFHVARDGKVMIERSPSLFVEFCLLAARDWFDMEPTVRRAQQQVLARYEP